MIFYKECLSQIDSAVFQQKDKLSYYTSNYINPILCLALWLATNYISSQQAFHTEVHTTIPLPPFNWRQWYYYYYYFYKWLAFDW